MSAMRSARGDFDDAGRTACKTRRIPVGDMRVVTAMTTCVKLVNYEESAVRFAAMRSNVVGRVVSLRGR